VFQYTEIQKCPCIETWRFCKAKLLIFSIYMFQYTVIQKSPFIKLRNFWIFVFQYTEIQKYLCIETWRFKNFHVLYTQIFLKRPITWWNSNRLWKYFRVWIRGLGTTNLWKKQSSKISCYCPFKASFKQVTIQNFKGSLRYRFVSSMFVLSKWQFWTLFGAPDALAHQCCHLRSSTVLWTTGT